MPEKIKCRECGQMGWDKGRSLCSSCRRRLEAEGVLDVKYPPWVRKGSKHVPRYKRFIPSRDSLHDGRWERQGLIWVWVWNDGRKPVDP